MKLTSIQSIFIIAFNFSSFINVCNCDELLIRCDNRPNITIDSIVKLNNSTVYVTSGNLYALVLRITSDHLPIIADGYPKLIDNNFKVLQNNHNNMSALDYEFVSTQYYLKGQNNDVRKFIGFNQVWMGCPQPLCIQGDIDAIMKDEGFDENALNIKIFRGKYYWEIGNYSEPPLVENAKLISDKWNEGLEPPIDAAFTTWAMYPIFFKGNKSYTFRFNGIVGDISKAYKGLPNDVNGVMYWDRGSIDSEYLFVFKDHRVWALRNNEVMDGWPKNISSFSNNFPTNISAAFIDYNDNAFLFKDSSFYTFKAENLESNELRDLELKPKLVFQDFFHCNESFYTDWGFGSYDQFVSDYYPKSQVFNALNTNASKVNTMQQNFISLNQTENNEPKINELNWLIVLIVIAVIVIFSVIGVIVLIYFISKIKKKSHEIQNIESIAVMRPLMKENGNHLEIISIEDIPRRTRKLNTKPKRTKFSDEAYG